MHPVPLVFAALENAAVRTAQPPSQSCYSDAEQAGFSRVDLTLKCIPDFRSSGCPRLP